VFIKVISFGCTGDAAPAVLFAKGVILQRMFELHTYAHHPIVTAYENSSTTGSAFSQLNA
jgi:hypothetical protein